MNDPYLERKKEQINVKSLMGTITTILFFSHLDPGPRIQVFSVN